MQFENKFQRERKLKIFSVIQNFSFERSQKILKEFLVCSPNKGGFCQTNAI